MREVFWSLRSVWSEEKRADWDDSVDFEQITCTANPGHMRAGRRITPLSVMLPNRLDDFVWTFMSDCLVQDTVVELFEREGVTGYALRPVDARFKRAQQNPVPRVWDLGITGWGGMARRESGVDLQESCPACGHLHYSECRDPSALINHSEWDGSDVFMVWPLPRFIFITDRVAKLIRAEELTGVEVLAVSDLEFLSGTGFSPGRLSYWFPEGLARQIGKPLGIY